MLLIIAFSTLTGISLGLDLRKKCVICSQLLIMCELMRSHLSYKLSNTDDLIEMLKNEDRLNDLKFLQSYDLEKRNEIETPLKPAENAEITSLFRRLGTTDLENQTRMIEGFISYITLQRDYYNQEYEKRRKLYAAFGLSGGLLIAIMLA